MFANIRWKWINLIAFIVMVAVNVMAELLPIGGMTTGDISAKYPSPLTPAGLSFGIWGVIYLCLAAFLLAQFTQSRAAEATERMGVWFLISCLANIGWILTWHYRAITFSLVMMIILLAVLAILEGRLLNLQETGSRWRWMIRAPIGIYYGWITVAAIANVSVWLVSREFDGFGLSSGFWQTVVLLIGCAIVSVGIWVNRDPLYGAAALWAYAGIMIKKLSPEAVGDYSVGSMIVLAVSCAVFILMSVIAILARPEAELPEALCICKPSSEKHQEDDEK